MNASENQPESSLGNLVHLSSENESLKQRILDMEKKIKELENEQISSERQKICDLEEKIKALETEKLVLGKKIDEWECFDSNNCTPISLAEKEILDRFITFSKVRESIPHNVRLRKNAIKRKHDAIARYHLNTKDLVKRCNSGKSEMYVVGTT